MDAIQYKGSYINSEFRRSQRIDESWVILSPSDFKDQVFECHASFEDVDQACQAAKEAFPLWSCLSLQERIEYLRKLETLFIKHKEDLALVISRETGKPLWESRIEAGALSGKIKVTIEYSIKLIEELRISEVLPGVDGVIRYRPKGVLAVIGPFNFPAHLPNGHFIPALLTGNTIVFKPSDKTPAVGQMMAEMFNQADFPKGVFNMIQGKASVGQNLCKHGDINGILFTGSYDVGLKIKRDTVEHYWKTLALEMGGKNASIIWEDASLDKAVYESIVGAFLTAGQRCSCTSRIFLHKNIFKPFLEKFKKMTLKLKVGYWEEENFMGPLISQESLDRYLRFQGIAQREGAETLIQGQELDLEKKGYYVSPSVHCVYEFNKESIYQKSEIFGPNVAIYPVAEVEETIEKVNSSGYGLVASVFTQDESLYHKFLNGIDVGLLNWNRTTNGASSRLPFGGTKKSGNERPSGHFAVYYCSTPVGSLEDRTVFDKNKVLPGISWV